MNNNNKLDGQLRRQLDQATTQHIYNRLPDNLQLLLSRCEWYITTRATALTLVITCPDSATNWEILNQVDSFACLLDDFAKSAKIRIYSSRHQETAMELRVDERSVYQNSVDN